MGGGSYRVDDPLEASYAGRVRRTAATIDVRRLFTTRDEVEAAQGVLRRYDRGEAGEAEYSEALAVVRSVLHPETGVPVPLPLRVSAIVPVNVCLDFLMITAQQYGPWASVGAHVLNQTYNAAHYRANRNASNDGSEASSARRLLSAYAGAVTGSVLTVLGLSRLVDRAPAAWVTASTRLALRRCVPFFGVAAADAINLGTMRSDEYTEGVAVRDASGRVVGRSRVAGRRAVTECVAGRIAAAAPILLVPPLLMRRLEAREWLRQRPRLRMPLMLGAVGVMLQVSVPLCFGMFRQTSWARPRDLEPEFHGLPDDARLYFNKGV